MPIRLILLVGLSIIFAGCSTGRYSGDDFDGRGGGSGMGVRYLLGRGVPQDDSKAFYYFKQAANSGDAFAQSEVAYMYAAGKGTSQDYTQALNYYQKAANQGLAGAQYNLGLMYIYGLGTAPNKVLGFEWVAKAASSGFYPAKQTLMQMRR